MYKNSNINFLLLMLFAAVAFGTQRAGAAPPVRVFADETVNYKVTYKWGLINKQAGTATLVLRTSGDHYHTKLTARSEPWADRLYSVRDTLNGVMDRRTLRPSFYEKIAHEGGEDKHDVVRFNFQGDHVVGECIRKVVKKGKVHVDDKHTLEEVGTTVDMLSSFYYMRSLPFDTWQKGHTETINIFSGKRKEKLTLSYQGIDEIKLDDVEYRCYHITFIFTGEGGKKTSDDMDAWITADAARIPVQLEGKLPVGKVRCIMTSYSGANAR